MAQTLMLSHRDRTLVEAILKAHLPTDMQVRVFGSRARQKARSGSDLDLLIQADRRLTPLERVLLEDAFEESDLPFRVDLVEELSLSPGFKASILADAVVL